MKATVLAARAADGLSIADRIAPVSGTIRAQRSRTGIKG